MRCATSIRQTKVPKQYPPDNFYEYTESNMIVCGECLTEDLRKTSAGELSGDEGVRIGMFTRLQDDKVEAYQCDGCLKQNAAYDEVGVDPETGEEIL